MDWKRVIGGVAPALARALGGPVAGVAVGALAKALGVEPEETAIEKKVKELTAADLLALKNAEHEFLAEMKKLEIDLDRLEMDDRASARRREVETKDSITPQIIAGVVLLTFTVAVYMTLSGHVAGLKDPVTAGIVGTLIGYASSKADQVVGYYFGSSAGSRNKDATIHNLKK